MRGCSCWACMDMSKNVGLQLVVLVRVMICCLCVNV